MTGTERGYYKAVGFGADTSCKGGTASLQIGLFLTVIKYLETESTATWIQVMSEPWHIFTPLIIRLPSFLKKSNVQTCTWSQWSSINPNCWQCWSKQSWSRSKTLFWCIPLTPHNHNLNSTKATQMLTYECSEFGMRVRVFLRMFLDVTPGFKSIEFCSQMWHSSFINESINMN